MDNRFIEAVERLRSKLRPNQYIYHGTNQTAGSSIRQQGFIPSADGKMGAGVYATSDPDYAKVYSGVRSYFSKEKPVLLRGRLPADVLNRGLAQQLDMLDYPRQELTKSQLARVNHTGVDGNEIIFKNKEEANEAFNVGGRKNRDSLKTAVKAFNTLKMLTMSGKPIANLLFSNFGTEGMSADERARKLGFKDAEHQQKRIREQLSIR